jgi:uncharacterized repeat protein (TIGR01451 family)
MPLVLVGLFFMAAAVLLASHLVSGLTAAAFSFDPPPASISMGLAAAATPPPRLIVSQKIVEPVSGEVSIGENVTFRITVRNVGVMPIGFIWLRDQYPPDSLVYVSSTPRGVDDGEGHTTWTGLPLPQGRLMPSASVSADITFRVIAAYPNMVNNAIASGLTTDGQVVPPFYGEVPIRVVSPNLFCKRSWVDHAPIGVPDFDQRQADWRHPTTGAWTYSGPVALANLLWWFDSGFESGTVSPPAMADTYPLVTAYSGQWDDHDPRNVPPLVEDLAYHLDTDGQRTGAARQGTDIYEMSRGLETYLAERGLSGDYAVSVTRSPDAKWVTDARVRRAGLAVRLLGATAGRVEAAGRPLCHRALCVSPWRAAPSGRVQ